MTSQSIYNFLFSRYTLFTFSLFLILVSMSAWLSLSEYGLKINDKIYQIDAFFKTPHTFLRYITFSFGFFLMIFSFSLPLKKERIANSFMIVIATYFIPLFFLLNLITPDGLNLVSLILTIVSLVYIVFYKKIIILNFNEKILMLSFILIFYFFMYSAVIHGSNLRELDNYARFLFAIPIYLFLRDIKFNPSFIYSSINISGILIGLFALYLYFTDSQDRIYGFTSTATIYGNISMLHFLFSFILMLNANKQSTSLTLPLLGMIFSLIAVVLTVSRGPLLAVPFVFLFLLINHKRLLFNVKYIILCLLIITSSVYSSGMFNRIIDGYNDIRVQSMDNLTTSWKSSGSIIPRIIIWQGSLNMIKQEPYWGIGLDKFNENLVEQIKDKKISPIKLDPVNPSAGFNHAHNQYLDIYAKTGIYGLIFFLLTMLIYLKIFYANLTAKDNSLIFGLLGITTILSYFAFMLTHVVFAHQQSTLFMLYTLTIFASIISNTNNIKVSK